MLSSIPPGWAARGQTPGSAEGLTRPEAETARRANRPPQEAAPPVRTELARPVDQAEASMPGDGTMRLRMPDPPPPDLHRLVGPRPAFHETPLERVRTERMQPPDPPHVAGPEAKPEATALRAPDAKDAPPETGDAPRSRHGVAGAYVELRNLAPQPAQGRVDRTG